MPYKIGDKFIARVPVKCPTGRYMAMAGQELTIMQVIMPKNDADEGLCYIMNNFQIFQERFIKKLLNPADELEIWLCPWI